MEAEYLISETCDNNEYDLAITFKYIIDLGKDNSCRSANYRTLNTLKKKITNVPTIRRRICFH